MTDERTAILKLADAVEQLRFIIIGTGEPASNSWYLKQAEIIDAAVSEVRASLSEAR